MLSNLKIIGLLLSLGLVGAVPALAASKVNVVTTVPDLAYAAREIGGNLVSVKALLKGTENPHFVDAVPEFTRLVANAQVVCMVGLELEIGYMPPVLQRSGNADVQPAGKGYCEAGKGITVLEKPTGPVDRSMGDVHPAGNPHFWLSPKTLGQSAGEIAAALERVDPTNIAAYQKGLLAFRAKMDRLSAEVAKELEPLLAAQKKAGRPLVIEYHKEFDYFFDQYGIKNFGSIEEKPGVPPSAGRIAQVATTVKAQGIRVAIAAEDNPAGTLARFHEISGVPVVTVPTMIQADGTYKTYPQLQKHIAEALVKAVIGTHAH